jgi:hypothetical protein
VFVLSFSSLLCTAKRAFEGASFLFQWMAAACAIIRSSLLNPLFQKYNTDLCGLLPRRTKKALPKERLWVGGASILPEPVLEA